MSLPGTINIQDDNFFCLENLILDPDLLYLYSLKDTDGLSEKSISLNTSEASQTTPLESYNSTINFEKDVYTKIRAESNEIIENKAFNMVKGLRNSMTEFHMRSSVQLASTLSEKIYNPFGLTADLSNNYDEIKDMALSNTLFDKLPGINPRKWPADLDTLLAKLEGMPVFGLFHEPLHYHREFFTRAQEFIDECLVTINSEKTSNEKRGTILENLTLASKVVVLIYLLSGDFPNYLKIILLIQKTSQSLAIQPQKLEYLNHLTFFASMHINKLKILSESTARLHYARSLCDEGGFKISKVAHFQKQTFLTSSLTTDGTYLYLYVSATNGGMYKIGTGQKDTVPGKLYLFAAVCRQEEVAWVYCKGKLYLRSSSKEFGSIDIIDPNTFKYEGMIQLYCPEVFGHPSLQIINKNYPLLTDGEYLYVIGKKLISEKINTAEEEEKKEEKLVEEEKKEPEIYKAQSIIKVPSNKFELLDKQEKEREQEEAMREEAERLKEIERNEEEESFKQELERIKEMEEKARIEKEIMEKAIQESLQSAQEKKPEQEQGNESKEIKEIGQAVGNIPQENKEQQKPPSESKESQEKQPENKPQAEAIPLPEKAEPEQGKKEPIPEEKKEVPIENQEKKEVAVQENQEKKEVVIQENQEKKEPENKEASPEKKEPVQENLDKKEPVQENQDKNQENKVAEEKKEDIQAQAEEHKPAEEKKAPNEEIKPQIQENKEGAPSENKEPAQEKKQPEPEKKESPSDNKEPPLFRPALPDISDKNLPNFEFLDSAPQKSESKGVDAEFEHDFFKPQKVDPKTFKDLMDKGDLKDIFKEKEPADAKDNSKAKSSLFNKKTLEKEKSGNPQAKREELKKKKEKKVNEIADSEHTLKLCEFILYEFDLANPLGVECFNETNMSRDKELIQELYESFNGFYSYNECARALSFNKDDIANAAQWLVDEGEKERTKKTILVRKSVLLAQAEVVSDISNKNLKNNAEIITKDDSLIFPMNVSSNIWTMNKDQLTLYSDTGIKIFSKKGEDVKPLLVLKKNPSSSNPEAQLMPRPETPIRPGFLSKLDEDFWKRNRDLVAQDNTELADSLLEQEDFFAKYSKILKPPTYQSDNKAKPIENPIFNDVPPWVKGGSYVSIGWKDGALQVPVQTVEKKTSQEKPGAKKIVLKGSHIQTIDGNKKGFHPHPNFHMCFDPQMRKYYILNWAWNSYTNVFPSLVTVAYDFENYEDRSFLVPFKGIRELECQRSLMSSPHKQGKEDDDGMRFSNSKEAVKELLIRILKLQKRRFAFPWKLNDWEYIYGYGLVEVMNKKAIIASLKDAEPEKKKLNAQRNKLVARINKYLESKPREIEAGKSINLREIKKNFGGCMDGSYETFSLINNQLLPFLEDLSTNLKTETTINFEALYLWLQYLLLWVKHSELLAVYPQRNCPEFTKLEQLLYSILKDPEFYHSQPDNSLMRQTLSLLWRIVIQGFGIFVRSSSLQAKWLALILSYSAKIWKYNKGNEILCLDCQDFDEPDLPPLAYYYLKNAKFHDSLQIDYPLKESLIEGVKPEEEIKKVDANSNFFNIYRKFRTLKLRDRSFAEPMGRLLIEDLDFLFHLKTVNNLFEEFYPNYFVEADNQVSNEKTGGKILIDGVEFQMSEFNSKVPILQERQTKHRKDSQALWDVFEEKLKAGFEVASPENYLIIRIFLNLVLEAWVELERIEDGFFEAYYQTRFARRLFGFCERVLAHGVKNLQALDKPYLNKLLSGYSLLFNSIFPLIHQSNILKYNTFDQNFMEQLMNILELMMTVSENNKGEKLNLLSHLFAIANEGIDQVQEKVFETNHPYERGKVQSFDQFHFPGALAISIEMDKRCQSDTQNDCLIIAGWYSHHLTSMGLQMSPRDGVGTCYRISGKPNMKRPLVLLGNTIQVEFSSSGHAKDEQSLNRWGFKVTAKAIYGCSKKRLFTQKLDVHVLQDVLQRFGSERAFGEWFHSLKVLVLLASELIEKKLKGSRPSPKELENTNYLKWSLIKKGLITPNPNSFLEDRALESRILGYKDTGENAAEEKLGVSEEGLDSESQNTMMKSLMKQNPDLGLDLKEDTFNILRGDLRARVLKERVMLPEDIRKKLEEIEQKDSNNVPAMLSYKQPVWTSFELDEKIRQCLLEIEARKGGFFEIISQIKSLYPEPMNLKSEKMRPRFTTELKKDWEFAENLVILTFLYHNGSLSINVNAGNLQYFKEQLGIIGHKKNNVLEWMIGQVQNEREWQFAVQELEDIQKSHLKVKSEKAIVVADKKEELLQEKPASKEKVLKKRPPQKKAQSKKPKEEERKQLEEKQEEKKEEAPKKPEYDEKLENELWKAFQQRYENNFDSIRNLCLLKNIQFTEEDPNVGLKEFFNICKSTLRGFKPDTNVHFESPYKIVASTLISKCLFLLRLGSYYTGLRIDTKDVHLSEENLLSTGLRTPELPPGAESTLATNNNNLSPPGLGRSISCQVEEKIDKDKLESFRTWIDSYQKWKVWQHKGESQDTDLQSESSNAYNAISSFLCSKAKTDELELCLQRQNHRCGKRITGLKAYSQLYSRIKNTSLEKYLLGLHCELFRFDGQRNVKCSGKSLKELTHEPFMQVLNALVESFNRKFKRLRKITLEEVTVEVNKVKMGGKFSELDQSIKDYLKLLYLNLLEISSMVSTSIPAIYWESWIEEPTNEEFYINILNLGIFARSLAFLSPNFEDLTLITQNLGQIIWLLSSRITENWLDVRVLVKTSRIILGLVAKEFGVIENKQMINIRVLQRLADLATIQRLDFLLSLLLNVLTIHETKLGSKMFRSEILTKDINILFHLLYFLNQPSLSRLLLKSLALLAPYLPADLSPTVFETGYFAKLAMNYDDLAKNNKAQNVHQLVQPTLFVKELQIDRPAASFPLSNISLLIEKLGQAILLQEDSKSLRKVLDTELARITKDLDYTKLLHSNLARHYSLGSENLLADPNQPPRTLTRDSKHCSSTSSLNSEKKPNDKQHSAQAKDTVVLIQLSNEEDISFLVNVLYYWEELYPSFSLKHPKTLDEFYKQKEEKAKRENEQKLTSIANSQNIEKVQPNLNQNQNVAPSVTSIYSHRIFEKLIINQPDFNLLDENHENLPFGWFLNYMGVFPDLKCPKTKLKGGKSKKCVKKVWANTNLLKMEKKFEGLIKTFEEIKENESLEDKVQTMTARNFIARMMHHIKDVKNIATMLNVFGFAPVLTSMPAKKAAELGYIINLGINNLLKPISFEHFKEEIRKKLEANPAPAQPPPQNPPQPVQKSNTKMLEAALNAPKSQMVISMCDQTIYQNFDFTIDFVTSLTANKDSFYTDCNKFSIVHRPAKSGSSNSSLIHELIEFLRVLGSTNKDFTILIQKNLHDMLETLNKEDRWMNLSQFDRNFFVGLSNIVGGWTQTLRTGALTSIKNLDRDNFCIVTQGGYTSGKKHCNIVSRNDPALIIQTVNADQLDLRFLNDWPKRLFELHYPNLLDSLRFIYNSFTKTKTSKDCTSDDWVSVTIMLRSLLKIAAVVDWNPLILKLPQEKLQILTTILLDLCHSCPVDKSYAFHEQAFANSWEKLVDKLDPASQLFSIPQSFERGTNFFEFELEAKKPLVSKPSEVNHGPADSPSSFVLPLSAYIESLPEHQQNVSEHKMLKYWEKHIIPRIQDFVRSSLKPWEFEDFFEQLRQPLRKGDQAKAAEVAYILCDQRLPAGVVLPDLNHDWNTITIEEVQIGQWAIAKLHNSNNQLYSQYFLPQVRLGNTEACVQMLAVDSKSNSVLVMFQDHENNQLISIWLPVLCLKLPEIPLSPHVACLDYETISEEFLKCVNNSVALLSRQVLLKFFSIEGFSKSADLQKEERLLKQFNLPFIEIIKWSVLEELSEDPVEGWLEANELNYLELEAQDSKNFIQTILQNRAENRYSKLKEIQVFLNYLTQSNSLEQINSLMSWLSETFPLICEFIPSSSNYINLYRASLENSNNPFPLNTFILPEKLQDSISALCVSFKQEATLCLCSGLKFFSDESGINTIHHIPAGKEARSKLKPLLFKMSQVYCSYYFNAEALPPYLQNQTSTTVPAMVAGIPSSWSVCCWLLDSLGTSYLLSGKEFAAKLLAEINKILVSCLQKLKIPAILRELLAKLMIRNLRKLHHVLYNQKNDKALDNSAFFEQKGVTPEFVWSIVEEVVKLKECQSLELYILYSSYIQELMELAMTILLPYTKDTENIKSLTGLLPDKAFPEGFLTLFNVLVISGFIREESHLTKDLFKECMDNIRLETQWDRLIYIENLPQEWSVEYIITSLGEIIAKNKGRVLLPNQDLYLPYDPQTKKHRGICMILLDGWAVMDIEEVVAAADKKEEEAPEEHLEEQKEEVSPVPEDAFWVCEVCTLENSEDLQICSCCESPKPAKKAPVVSEKEIALQMKRNDLSEVEKEIQKKDQLRFEKFLQDLNGFVQKYYDDKEKEKEDEKQKEKEKEDEKVKQKEQNLEASKKEVVLNPAEEKKKRNKENKEKKKQEKLKKKEEAENQKKLKKELKKLKKKQKEEEDDEEENVEESKQIGEDKEEEKKEALEKGEEEKKEVVEKLEEQKIEEPKEEKMEAPQEKLEEKPLEKPQANLEKKLENLEEIQPKPSSPLIKASDPKDDPMKSPEFSKVPEEFPAAKKCVVLFGQHIFENKAANSCLKEMLKDRCVTADNGIEIFKQPILDQLKTIYYGVLMKQFEKGMKEKLSKFSHMLNVASFEEFVNGLLQQVAHNPLDFWKLLEVLGFDFWLTNAGFHPQEKPQLIPLKHLSDLMKYIEIDLCQETKAVLTFSALNIRLMGKSPLQEKNEKAPINYFNEITLETKYYQLYKYQLKDLRFAWSLLKIFNANLIPSIPFINMRTNDYSFDQIWLSLSTYLSCLREIWMMPIKRELSHKVLQKTAVNREEVPKIILERLKLNRESGRPVPRSGISIKNKDDFIFSKSHEQLKEMPTTLLRPLKPQGAEPHISFEVIFKGENVMGEAGPYRQYFADISMELQPSALNPFSSSKNLNLLCPSPNNDAKLGRGRDKFVINPSARSSYHLQLFEFLGILMGCSVRTGTHLTLDLPLLFWKQLVGQKVDFEDLEEVDESLKDLVNIFQNYSRAQFEETIMETFSTTLSNKTVVELKKGGSKIPVQYEDRFEYVQKVLQARMRESILQIEAIKKGLTLLIPLPFLNGMSAKDLEIWVSGKPKVNIELLKRHTRYAGDLNEESRRVKFLWEVLSNLKENEKLRFVKFCWGQERLPANDEEFERTQTRFMIKPANYASSNTDKALPRADTCFFNLELPDYSTKEILKERFILAINTDCDSMNAEDPKNLDPNMNQNNGGDESSYDQEEEN